MKTHPVDAQPTEGSPRWQRLRLTALSLALAGCATQGGQGGQSGMQDFGKVLGDIVKQMPTQTPTTPTPTSLAQQLPTQLPQTRGVQPLTTRPPGDLSQLMNKGTVSGAELLTELRAIRMAMRERRTAQTMSTLLGSADQQAQRAQQGQSVDVNKFLTEQALAYFEATIKQSATTVAYKALDGFLNTLIDDPAVLQRETIKLPSPRGMTAVQQQRVVSMAAIVIAMRVSNKVLVKAKEDFAAIESDYGQLLDRREQAAALLYDALARRGQGDGRSNAEFAGALSERDLAFLDNGLASLPLKDFANDMAAQNLALAFLRQRDPQAFAAYRSQADGALRRTKGYVRTALGVAAFGGLVTSFSREFLAAMRTRQVADILQALPFGMEFVKEAPPLMSLAVQTSFQGVVVEPLKLVNPKRFRVVEGAQTEELGSSGDVFATLKKRQADALLNEALFRNGAVGLVYKLYMCDKEDAGRMLDAAVPTSEREAFAKAYLSADPGGFSFVNSFTVEGAGPRERDLGDELLRRDHRVSSPDATLALGNVQRVVTNGYSQWSNDQLMRLIFANREGAAVYATLQLGNTLVRPVPSMQSLYAYESLVDGCRSLVNAEPVRPGGPARPAPAAAPVPPRPAAARPAPPPRPAVTRPAPQPAPTPSAP